MRYKGLASYYKVILFIILAAMLLILASCGKKEAQPGKFSFYEGTVDSGKPIAWGEDRDIYVFCDEPVWKLAEDMLRRSLERETYIVVNERYFNLIRADISEIEQLIKFKNLLFMGDLKSKGAVSEHLRNSMQDRMIERVQNSGGELFVAKNRWVNDQLVVYMVGDKAENLLKLNILQTNRLYTEFLNRFAERLAYQAYRTKLVPEEFFEAYPFTLKIPESFQLYHNAKANNFLSFLYRMRSESREFPDRYISVYYEDMPTDTLRVNWLLTRRKELAFKYYDEDEFDPKLLRSENVTLGKYKALRILGPWQNRKHDIGGGFQAFAFYDHAQKRAYLIDNSVYYPAGDKLPELLLLQKISATFKTK